MNENMKFYHTRASDLVRNSFSFIIGFMVEVGYCGCGANPYTTTTTTTTTNFELFLMGHFVYVYVENTQHRFGKVLRSLKGNIAYFVNINTTYLLTTIWKSRLSLWMPIKTNNSRISDITWWYQWTDKLEYNRLSQCYRQFWVALNVHFSCGTKLMELNSFVLATANDLFYYQAKLLDAFFIHAI